MYILVWYRYGKEEQEWFNTLTEAQAKADDLIDLGFTAYRNCS